MVFLSEWLPTGSFCLTDHRCEQDLGGPVRIHTMPKRPRKSPAARIALATLAIAGTLHFISCRWSTAYFDGSPTAIVGVENMVGIYAKHSRQDDLMLGILVPSALVCVAVYISREA